MQNQTIFELCTDDRKSKYSCNPKDILTSAKKIMKKIYSKQTSAAATTEFLNNVSSRKKRSNEHFNLCEAKIPFDESFSNELAPVYLDSCRKLGTMGVTSRTGIIILSCINKVIKKILKTVDPFHYKLIL